MEITNGYALYNYLYLVEKTKKIEITLKDIVGFLDQRLEVRTPVIAFTYHHSSYCQYIKTIEPLYRKCLHASDLIRNRFNRNPEAFWGTCHAGIQEFVIPVICGDILIGAICIGHFKCDPRRYRRRLHRLSQHSGFNKDTAFVLYSRIPRNRAHLRDEELLSIFEPCRHYLAGLYQSKAEAPSMDEIPAHETREQSILRDAESFIKMKLAGNVSLSAIADSCGCSKSFLSHCFKRQTGRSIREYVNRARIQKAQLLLRSTSIHVTDIAYSVGYNDSNYFSRIFTRITGTSPSEFRQSDG